MTKLQSFLKRNFIWMAALVLLAGFVVISGRTGSCPTCVAITQMAGIVPATESTDPESFERLDVGDTIPSGSLTGSDGKKTDVLEDVLEGPTVLVFYRGGWCPFCNRHLSAIVDIIPELDELGVKLVAISPDSPAKLRAKPELQDLTYTLYSDSPMLWTRQFGIAFKVPDDLVEKYLNSYNIDLEGDSGYSHHLLPHPSVYVVDRQGVIQFSYVNENYKVRLEPERILEAVKSVIK